MKETMTWRKRSMLVRSASKYSGLLCFRYISNVIEAVFAFMLTLMLCALNIF